MIYIYIYIYVYVHTYIHIYICVYIYIYIYPPAPRATRLWSCLLQVIKISSTSPSIFQVFKFFNESFDFEPSV